MKNNTFIANESCQTGYTYSLAEPLGWNYDPQLQPQTASKKYCLRVYWAAATAAVGGTNSRP